MACPYFLPANAVPARCGRIRCACPWATADRKVRRARHEGAQPTDTELKDGCNLGYARCRRLPQQRPCDAVRFVLARDRDHTLDIQYVCEIGHAPGAHGMLEFDTGAARWTVSHPDPRLQKLAECYLDSYLRRKQGS